MEAYYRLYPRFQRAYNTHQSLYLLLASTYFATAYFNFNYLFLCASLRNQTEKTTARRLTITDRPRGVLMTCPCQERGLYFFPLHPYHFNPIFDGDDLHPLAFCKRPLNRGNFGLIKFDGFIHKQLYHKIQACQEPSHIFHLFFHDSWKL